MNYQLILQFRGESLQNFAPLTDLEDQVEDILEKTESLDGLDAGGHGANLFVYTDNPKRTFQRIQPLLNAADLAAGFTAAYRTVADEKFRIIWPLDATAIFSLR
jgi:hypothetical protein